MQDLSGQRQRQYLANGSKQKQAGDSNAGAVSAGGYGAGNNDDPASVEWIDRASKIHRQRQRKQGALDVIRTCCRNLFTYHTNRVAMVPAPCACSALALAVLAVVGVWAYWVAEEGFYMPLDVVSAPSVSVNYQRLVFSQAAAAEEQTLNAGTWRPFQAEFPRPRWCTGLQNFVVPGLNNIPSQSFRTSLSGCLTPEVSRNLLLNFRRNPYDKFRLTAHTPPTTVPDAGVDAVIPTALVIMPGSATNSSALYDKFVGPPINMYFSNSLDNAGTQTPVLDEFAPTGYATLSSLAEQQCDVSFSNVDLNISGATEAVRTAGGWFDSGRTAIFFLTGLGSVEFELQM